MRKTVWVSGDGSEATAELPGFAYGDLNRNGEARFTYTPEQFKLMCAVLGVSSLR